MTAARKMTKSEAAILNLLMHRRYVPHETIYSHLYQLRAEAEKPDPYVIHSFVYALRRKLPPNVTVKNVYGEGYSLRVQHGWKDVTG